MTAPDDAVPVLQAIRERRSLRAFTAQAVDEVLLDSLFEAARWAPSSGNGQPWRFVVTRRGRPEFDGLAATLTASNAWAAAAPVLVLTAACAHHVHPTKSPKPNRHALLELGLAVGNLLTQATELGLTAHPIAGFDSDAAAERTGVPDDVRVGVLLAIGWPGDSGALAPEVRAKDQRPRERIPRAELVYQGRWGERRSQDEG